jgi:hypothetical protein
MGRMLEALNQTDARKEPSAKPNQPLVDPIIAPEPVQDLENEPTAAEEQIPFIEVGGPRSVVDASADVLASAPTKAASEPIKMMAEAHQEETTELPMEGSLRIWCSWTIRKGVKLDQ